MASTDFIVFDATCQLLDSLGQGDLFKVRSRLTIKRPFTSTVDLSFEDEYYFVLDEKDFRARDLPSLFESAGRHNARGLLKDLSHAAVEFSSWSRHHNLDSVGFEEYPHAMRFGPFVVGGTVQEGYRFLLARDL